MKLLFAKAAQSDISEFFNLYHRVITFAIHTSEIMKTFSKSPKEKINNKDPLNCC